ncbi:MAG: calcium/sodium antiporter [Methylicorpusculum sp.]|uniref:calcium/sodium antiporter n=1 Tax=Methylicorpusculum sp. TaxID=2713644 RepID=UPI002728F0EC|nr:calcium/sodium antiporter [Methylicorpusculum sp.]MDO8937599.1 calcium/sodium antiporter [Methylicorpusculum sp.]MDO9240371.1 calcium/sodium antiporter [Methylicorpusculum sp.]MDP2180681.1 calcium/sodium antiporter [Methylicorpusculum sp.]MDP2203739.1 calcium/sodium antiporter [Methylicorpusculum sp.]MDP3529263.1 calcium/sodium antiporter [Methylicorpusculum sp.]
MALSIVMIVLGLALLVWSADRFVEGAASVARHLGMPPLLIGMVIVGFGTSAPEMTVSALAAMQGNPGLALGNGYGSNIANIAMILGITALISPITVHSQIIKKELPILAAVTLFALFQIYDGEFSRMDAIGLLGVFFLIIGWSIYQGIKNRGDALAQEVDSELDKHPMPFKKGIIWVVVGLVLLIVSSRMLVWGAVNIAHSLGVSDLIIGLTIVAIGTSLPELASSIIAARKGEDDIAIGNVIGSNLFNTTAVIGIAGAIQPMSIPSEILTRDWPVMALLTLGIFILGYSRDGKGSINRIEGGVLLSVFVAYTGYLAISAL